MPVPLAFHWSGGKDSAHALGRLLGDDRYDVRCLVTTVHASRQESTVHGIPVPLLRAQADAIGLPLRVVELAGPGLDDYPEVMDRASRELHAEGVRAVGFGDQAHSGVLQYKLDQFGPLGLEVVEPLWDLSPEQCSEEYLGSGIEAVVVVVDASVLGREHLGRHLDRALVASLPDGCDPGGEFGEYHTFVTSAPFFTRTVPMVPGRVEHLRRSLGTTDGRREFNYWRLHLATPGP